MTRTALGLQIGDCVACFDGVCSTGEVGQRRDGSPVICFKCGGSGRDLLNATLPFPQREDTQ